MSDLNTDNNQVNVGNQNMGINKRSPKIGIIIVVVGVIIIGGVGWGYSSGMFNFLGINKNTSNNNTPTTSLPPLTEAQKQEAAQAPEGMVYVPEGEYLSGIPANISKDAPRPLRKIKLTSFYIDRLEVTTVKFYEFTQVKPEWNKGKPPYNFAEPGYLSYFGFFNGSSPGSDYAQLPAQQVSWHAAKAYCEWQGKRLPTLSEWEKTARGTDGRAFPWGNNMDSSRANFCDKNCPVSDRTRSWNDGYENLAPAGSFPEGVSPYGALDMSGNVQEWVADWFAPKSEYYKTGPDIDPQGPEKSSFKAVMGGGYLTADNWGVELYQVAWFMPNGVMNDTGFRCAKDVK